MPRHGTQSAKGSMCPLRGEWVHRSPLPWLFLLVWLLWLCPKGSKVVSLSKNLESWLLGGARIAFHLASFDLFQAIDAPSVRASPSPEQAPGGERPPQIPGRKSPTLHSRLFPDEPRSAISKGQGPADKGWLLLRVKKSILDKHSPRDQGGAAE